MNKQKVIFLVGPTAIGKSEIAVILAKKIGAEIISCDSMQVYRKMNIVTAMPAPALRRKVRHHLLGLIDPHQEYDVSLYRARALKAIAAIIRRKKVPLFVGGAGLYMSVLIDGLFPQAGRDEGLRLRLMRQAAQKGPGFLHAQLKKIDPAAAGKIHAHDLRRTIRALEVYRLTGKRISDLQKERSGLRDTYDVRVVCLSMKRDSLYRRINERVERMFSAGLVKQVRKLLVTGVSRTASFAIGVGEVKGYLDGVYDLTRAKELVKLNSRHYAKRQLTWFRKDKRIQWVTVKDGQQAGKTVQAIWKKLS